MAQRAVERGGLNEIARVRHQLTAAGTPPLDLSDSNPTRHGLMLPEVLEAVRRHTYDVRRYDPHPRGPLAAREALARRYGGEPDDYWLTSSTSQAYSWLFTVLADPGDAVAVPAPGYPLTGPLARYADLSTACYRLDYVHPDGWLLDAESLRLAAGAAGATPAARAVVAVNPGNPTGAYVGENERRVMVDTCAQGDAALISDEVFVPFALDGKPHTLAGETRVPTFTLNGLSKLLCAPQLKLGWIRLSGPETALTPVRDALDAVADTFLPVSAPIAAALPELLDLADESVAATRMRLRTNLASLHVILSDGPYRVRRCDGGWTALVDVPRYVPSDELVVRLMRRAGLVAHPGWFYDVADDGVLALSLLPSPDAFGDGINRLRRAIEEIGEEQRGV